MTFAEISGLFRATAGDPVGGARRFIALDLPRQVLWMGFAAVIVVSVILVTLIYKVTLVILGPQLPPEFVTIIEEGTGTPILSAAMQAVLMLMAVHALDRLGRALGGTGTFDGALTVAVVMGVFYNGILLVDLAVLLLFPVLMAPIGLAALLYMMWLAPGLVMGLHGFRSRFVVLLTMFATFVVLNLVFALLGAILLGGSSGV